MLLSSQLSLLLALERGKKKKKVRGKKQMTGGSSTVTSETGIVDLS